MRERVMSDCTTHAEQSFVLQGTTILFNPLLMKSGVLLCCRVNKKVGSEDAHPYSFVDFPEVSIQ
jgi:hypothetical protein